MQQQQTKPNPQQLFIENASDIYNQLFTTCKINPIVHNTNAPQKHSSQSSVSSSSNNSSHITAWLLKKLLQYGDQPWKFLNEIQNSIDFILDGCNQIDNIYSKATNQYNSKKNQLKYKCVGNVHFLNEQSIYIGKGTTIQHGALITGPCLIGQNCQIRKGAYIRGNVIIGDGTLIGNSCELKNSVLMDYCQIAHFNYIGDSVLGIHAHFSAGAITSNYKFDGSEISIPVQTSTKVTQQKEQQQQHVTQKDKNTHSHLNKNIKSGRNKLGALIGHNAEIGCNTILNPGSVIGQNSIVYPLVNWRGFLPSNRICKLAQSQQIVERRQL